MKSAKLRQKIAPFVERLDGLKDKMLQETDFREIYTYFLDNLADDPQFKKIGKEVKRPEIKRLAARIGKEVTGTGHVTKLILIKVPKYPFLHGPLFVDGCMSNLIFFEDIHIGLMAILLPTRETHFVRVMALTEQEAETLKNVH